MISPEEGPGCQGLHYIFNYNAIHMVTLQYVQLLNVHPSPAARSSRAQLQMSSSAHQVSIGKLGCPCPGTPAQPQHALTWSMSHP